MPGENVTLTNPPSGGRVLVKTSGSGPGMLVKTSGAGDGVLTTQTPGQPGVLINYDGVPPDAPLNPAALSGTGSVALAWSASAGATTYNIYRGTSSGAETLLATGV